MVSRGLQRSFRTHCRLAALTAASLGGIALASSLGASPAGALVVRLHGRTYGVTPVVGTSPTGASGQLGVPGIKGRSRALAPRNFDVPPDGGGSLIYHGGPVMHGNTTHLIYWEPGEGEPDEKFTPTTKAVVGKFFSDVAHDSGIAGNVFAVDAQYTDATGNAAYSSTLGSEETDTDPYPSGEQNCAPSNEVGADTGPYTTCLFDSEIQQELSEYIDAHHLPRGPTQLYFVLTPHDVVTCLNQSEAEELENGPICSNNAYCAYHGSIGSDGAGSEIIYADIPFSLLDSGYAKGCQNDGNANVQLPNGDPEGYADVALKAISHEFSESITDPFLDGWFDINGLEVGDKCNGVTPDPEKDGIGYDPKSFLPTLGGSSEDGNLFDQVINGDRYYLQSEWDNATGACAMRPVGLGAAFTVSPAPAAAGSPVSFNGVVVDPYGEPTVTWSFGDGATAIGSSPSHIYPAPGAYTVTMTARDPLTGSTAPPVSRTVVIDPSSAGSVAGQIPDSTGPGAQGVAGSRVIVPAVKLTSTTLQVTAAGAVSVKITCPEAEASCTGTITLRTLGAVIAGLGASARAKAAILTLASGVFAVPGGKVKTVTLRLSSRARALLARSHVLRVRATLIAHDPAGAAHTTRADITLRAPKAQHRKH